MSDKTDSRSSATQPSPWALMYWRRTQRLTMALLALWFGVTFSAAFFARELDFMLFGWPFSFWFCAQGALLLFLAIVCVYAWRMERLEVGVESQD